MSEAARPFLMVSLFICVLVVAIGYFFWHLSKKSSSRRYGWQLLWRLACPIGATRIGALWLGAATNSSPGWAQIPGYFLQLVGLPEIYLVRSMRNTPLKWATAASLLLLISSFVWAASFVWVANRFPLSAKGGKR